MSAINDNDKINRLCFALELFVNRTISRNKR